MTKVMRECKYHGIKPHTQSGNRFYCVVCNKQKIRSWRQKLKIKAIEYKGGKCEMCGLVDKDYPSIYEFHHTDPTKKDFGISKSYKSFDSMKEELDKCILVCANCHRRLHY